MFRTTVTVLPPGLMVSCSFSVIRLEEVTVIVALAPAASEPDAGETVRFAAAEMEYLTGPPLAVRVNVPTPWPFTATSTSVLSDTLRVPGGAGADDDAGAAAAVDPDEDTGPGAEVDEPEVPGAAGEPGPTPAPGAVVPGEPADGASPPPRRLATHPGRGRRCRDCSPPRPDPRCRGLRPQACETTARRRR